jgi:hypothetical protein
MRGNGIAIRPSRHSEAEGRIRMYIGGGVGLLVLILIIILLIILL